MGKERLINLVNGIDSTIATFGDITKSIIAQGHLSYDNMVLYIESFNNTLILMKQREELVRIGRVMYGLDIK